MSARKAGRIGLQIQVAPKPNFHPLSGRGRMKAKDYIEERQRLWALRRGIALVPASRSAAQQARPGHTKRLEDNLFQQLSREVQDSFDKADGQELRPGGKMYSLHSSSALCCNVFHYWRSPEKIPVIAEALGLSFKSAESLRFEAKFPVVEHPDRGVFKYDPNIDVVIECSANNPFRRIGIECKFAEAFGGSHKGLSPAYLSLREVWKDIPHCRSLAEMVSPCDNSYRYLHAAQLIKHILGLKHACGKKRFLLLYLWYDVPCAEAADHRQEIERFADRVRADGIAFQSITYQEVIFRLAQDHREDHHAYVDYLVERYM